MKLIFWFSVVADGRRLLPGDNPCVVTLLGMHLPAEGDCHERMNERYTQDSEIIYF